MRAQCRCRGGGVKSGPLRRKAVSKDNRWAGSQSERWRYAVAHGAAGSAAEGLAEAIATEIQAGMIPPGALLPTANRLAFDLMVEESVVGCAYDSLQKGGLIETRADGRMCVAAGYARADAKQSTSGTIVQFDRASRSGQRPGEGD